MKSYHGHKSSSAVKEQALDQFRKTYKKLEKEHPELLESTRQKIFSMGSLSVKESSLSIDRKKNIGTVIKFLEIKAGVEFRTMS